MESLFLKTRPQRHILEVVASRFGKSLAFSLFCETKKGVSYIAAVQTPSKAEQASGVGERCRYVCGSSEILQ
jgi:hypothetical protein